MLAFLHPARDGHVVAGLVLVGDHGAALEAQLAVGRLPDGKKPETRTKRIDAMLEKLRG